MRRRFVLILAAASIMVSMFAFDVPTARTAAAATTLQTSTVPGTPTAVSAQALNGGATVSWGVPASNGSAISGYVITPYVGGKAQAPVQIGGNPSTYTVWSLANGSSYTFTVAARNGNGVGAASALTAAVIPSGKPLVPSGVSAVAGVTSATVSWTGPSNNGSAITGYAVTPYVAGAAQPTVVFHSAAATDTVTGLTNGTAYSFAVAAINTNGTSGLSKASPQVVPSAIPGTPTAVSAQALNGGATVSWGVPASNGSAISGYVITPYVGGKAQAPVQIGGNPSTYTVWSLANGSSYTFTVAAVNAAGLGPASALTAAVIPSGKPLVPSGVSAVAGVASATVSWTAPSNNGSAITGYAVTPYVAGAAQPTVVFHSAAATDTVTGLTNGTAYSFAVAAINTNGTSGLSSASPQVVPSAIPGTPSAVSAQALNGGATVSWGVPASNGSAISGYVLTPYVGDKAQVPVQIGGNPAGYTVWNLINGTSYAFTVAAVNGNGVGPASALTAAVIPSGKPFIPSGVTAAAGVASATVSWAAPAGNGSAITGYAVTPYVAGVAQPAEFFNSPATTETLTGLANGTAYSFAVAALNANGISGLSSASPQVVPSAIPGTLTGVSAQALNGGATVSWGVPASNGSAISGYVITPYVGGKAQAPVRIGGNPSTYSVWSLANGTSYTFTVAAVNADGLGPTSAPTAAVIPSGKPLVPSGVSAVAGVASATVSWTAPSNNGSAITGYAVTPYVAGAAQQTLVFNSPATSETLTALANGSPYAFAVAAINANGTSGLSSASSQVVPSALPGTPTGVGATPLSSGATVWWAAPASVASPVSGYVVTPYLNSLALPSLRFNSTMSAEAITGLTAGATYQFTVTAINGVGVSGPSALTAPVTVAAPQVTFEDDFNGPAGADPNTGMGRQYWYLDPCWTTGCGNATPTRYSASNAYLDGSGDLVLEADQGATPGPACGPVTCQYTAAGLTMFNWNKNAAPSWSQEYGTFSARIKMPTGQGLWPAFWMVGSNAGTVGSPYAGEIDVTETHGQAPAISSGHAIGEVPGTGTAGRLNFGDTFPVPAAGVISGWHTYSVTWSPYGIEWQIDGITMQTMSPQQAGPVWASSLSHPFGMLLDLTVGGGNQGLPDASTVFPAKMLVDDVQVTSS